jgi:hypothetical protein
MTTGPNGSGRGTTGEGQRAPSDAGTPFSFERVRIRGQSEISQQRRLRRGRCPVHGLVLHPSVLSVYDGFDLKGQLGTCPRKDCDLSFVLLKEEVLAEVDGVKYINAPARRLRKGEEIRQRSACSELETTLAVVGFHKGRRRGLSKEKYERKMHKLNMRLLETTARAVLEILKVARKHLDT